MNHTATTSQHFFAPNGQLVHSDADAASSNADMAKASDKLQYGVGYEGARYLHDIGAASTADEALEVGKQVGLEIGESEKQGIIDYFNSVNN